MHRIEYLAPCASDLAIGSIFDEFYLVLWPMSMFRNEAATHENTSTWEGFYKGYHGDESMYAVAHFGIICP